MKLFSTIKKDFQVKIHMNNRDPCAVNEKKSDACVYTFFFMQIFISVRRINKQMNLRPRPHVFGYF